MILWREKKMQSLIKFTKIIDYFDQIPITKPLLIGKDSHLENDDKRRIGEAAVFDWTANDRIETRGMRLADLKMEVIETQRNPKRDKN